MTILAAIAFGGFWRRWLGGPWGRRWYKISAAWVVAFAFAIGAGLPALDSAAVAAILVALWLPGHGSYMDMGTVASPDDEATRHLFRWAWPAHARDAYWYDFVGMSLRYILPAGVLGALMAYLDVPAWWVMPLSGAAVAPAYAAVWWASKCDYFPHTSGLVLDGPTAYGEVFAGAIVFGGYAVALYA